MDRSYLSMYVHEETTIVITFLKGNPKDFYIECHCIYIMREVFKDQTSKGHLFKAKYKKAYVYSEIIYSVSQNLPSDP